MRRDTDPCRAASDCSILCRSSPAAHCHPNAHRNRRVSLDPSAPAAAPTPVATVVSASIPTLLLAIPAMVRAGPLHLALRRTGSPLFRYVENVRCLIVTDRTASIAVQQHLSEARDERWTARGNGIRGLGASKARRMQVANEKVEGPKH